MIKRTMSNISADNFSPLHSLKLPKNGPLKRCESWPSFNALYERLYDEETQAFMKLPISKELTLDEIDNEGAVRTLFSHHALPTETSDFPYCGEPQIYQEEDKDFTSQKEACNLFMNSIQGITEIEVYWYGAYAKIGNEGISQWRHVSKIVKEARQVLANLMNQLPQKRWSYPTIWRSDAGSVQVNLNTKDSIEFLKLHSNSYHYDHPMNDFWEPISSKIHHVNTQVEEREKKMKLFQYIIYKIIHLLSGGLCIKAHWSLFEKELNSKRFPRRHMTSTLYNFRINSLTLVDHKIE